METNWEGVGKEVLPRKGRLSRDLNDKDDEQCGDLERDLCS